jgi:hypothetical protein
MAQSEVFEGELAMAAAQNAKTRSRRSSVVIMGPDCRRIRAGRSTVCASDRVLAKDRRSLHRNRGPADVSTEHLQLMAKDHDFQVLGVLVAPHEPSEGSAEDQGHERPHHGGSSCSTT